MIFRDRRWNFEIFRSECSDIPKRIQSSAHEVRNSQILNSAHTVLAGLRSHLVVLS